MTALKYLKEIANSPIIAADFEVAVKYPKSLLDDLATQVSNGVPKQDEIKYQSMINATALGHPSHCTITHCSIATSEDTAYVFILDSKSITNLVLNYLIASPQQQLWHNATYDFRHLMYRTGQIPPLFEDTQILAKTLINHTNPFVANTKLKHLAGSEYGDWAISADDFSLERMYDSHVIKYAAIDACATYWLWNYMNAECDLLDYTPEEASY